MTMNIIKKQAYFYGFGVIFIIGFLLGCDNEPITDLQKTENKVINETEVQSIKQFEIDIKKGAQLFKAKACNTCHGNDAKQPIAPRYPKLAGQDETYLVNQMMAIRDKKRMNNLSGTMRPFTMGLTDKNLADLAAWISSQPE
ncbi:cytochrome c554 [Beggiatoa sp. PS]|nr:cytochrome c554 [Beggiatoa sp. PS]